MTSDATRTAGRSELKTAFALRRGQVVHISELAGSGLQPDCVCPCCLQPLVAKRGKVRVEHFAHLPAGDAVPCPGETILHQFAKLILATRVERCLRDGGELRAVWECEECGEAHAEDLVAGVNHFAVERELAGGGGAKPDLALFDGAGVALRVVEVVVTHAPEPVARAAYAALKTRLFEVRVKQPEDLERLWADTDVFARCAHCPAPRCRRCKALLVERRVFVVTAPCWSCQAPLTVTLPADDDCLDEGAAAPGETVCCGGCSRFVGRDYLVRTALHLDATRTTPAESRLVCPTRGLSCP